MEAISYFMPTAFCLTRNLHNNTRQSLNSRNRSPFILQCFKLIVVYEIWGHSILLFIEMCCCLMNVDQHYLSPLFWLGARYFQVVHMSKGS